MRRDPVDLDTEPPSVILHFFGLRGSLGSLWFVHDSDSSFTLKCPETPEDFYKMRDQVLGVGGGETLGRLSIRLGERRSFRQSFLHSVQTSVGYKFMVQTVDDRSTGRRSKDLNELGVTEGDILPFNTIVYCSNLHYKSVG